MALGTGSRVGRVAARLLWTMFQRHPWAAELMSMTRPQLMPNLLDYTEWTLGPLRELGVDVNTMMFFHLTVFGHVRSTAMNLNAETQAEQDTGMTADEWVETQGATPRDLVTSGRYPTFEHVIGQSFDFDLDTLFEFGLRRLLDGFEVLLRQRSRSR
jgi:hypothetical protein